MALTTKPLCMKKLQLVVTGMLLCCSMLLYAQQKEQNKTSPFPFSSINQAGLILGDDEYELLLQSINGVRYKSWFAGVGVGIDYYYLRSIPVFLDVRKTVRPGKWPLFVYGDVGVNMAWLKDADKEDLWYSSKINKGLYYDVGAGLDFKFKKSSFIISGGYSTKELHEVRTYAYIWGPPGLPDKRDFVDYQFSRLVLKAGFRF